MLSSITLKRPQNKDEECKLLDDIAELVHGDTYLAELFTPAMVAYEQSVIKNDFVCNLYQEYLDECKEAEMLKSESKKALRDYYDLKETCDLSIQNKNKFIQQMQETIDKIENRYNEQASACNEIAAEHAKLQRALSDREMEICQLKAKLYDLNSK
jgi:septation ring formation regulator EzrA